MAQNRLLGCLPALLALTSCNVAQDAVPSEGAARTPQLTAWAVRSLERVSGTGAAPAAQTPISLWAARGEDGDFQVVLRAQGRPLTNVDVIATDLRSGRNRIPASNLDLFREHYIHVSRSSPDLRGSNRPLGSGWYPDALIPLHDSARWGSRSAAEIVGAPFNLAADRNQPIWIDFYVPREADPGPYRGALDVKSDQGALKIDFTINVWNFTLPERPSLRSSITIDKPLAENRQAQEELIRNRLMPRATNPGDEQYYCSKYGMSTTGLWFWSNADAHRCSMLPAPSVAEIKEEMRRHSHCKGVEIYVYSADEINRCTKLVPDLKQWARNIHAAGAKNLLTAAPVEELQDDGSGTGRSVADIWALLPKMFETAPTEIQRVRAKGDEIWFYTALVDDSYSPKWLLDFLPANYRIQPGFLNEALDLKGILYWSINAWGLDPLSSVDLEEDGRSYPGEGVLAYPGEKLGRSGYVVPSMRLKWLRDGVEDYEYVELLKKSGRGAWALTQVKRAAVDWKNWTKDPKVFESVHRQLGDALSKVP